MAQLSHRTGSLNSIFRASPDTRTDDCIKVNNQVTARRISSSSNHKIKTQHSLVALPETPVIHRASEAHIHRIRCATSRSDLKRNLQLRPPSVGNPKPLPNEKDLSESDNDEVESVDWTSPLDITAYLYKPEYIIRPSSKSSRENIGSISSAVDDKDNDEVAECNASRSNSALKLPTISEEKVTLTKKEFVKSYVRRSMRRDFKLNRDTSDYTSFIKELGNELREMSQETKRMENQLPHTKTTNQEARDEILHRGYVTLKRIYELNPDLTESAAKKNICGPPGNHWMGLTRVEVLKILQRIRKELDVPPEKYGNYGGLKMSFLNRESKKSVKKATRKSKKQQKGSSTTKGKKKATTRHKTPQVPFKHVPGPKHLHTNICIRPWEPTLDGWNQAKDDNERDQSARSPRGDCTNPPNSPRKSTQTQNSLSDDHGNLSTSHNANEEDYLTLEIFNPIFKVYR